MQPQRDGWGLDELAERSGVTARNIRFYQQQGLLRSSGKRGTPGQFDDSDLERLKLIQTLKDDGLILRQIRELIGQMAPGDLAGELGEPNRGRTSAAAYARSVRMAADRGTLVAREAAPLARVGGPSSADRRRAAWERISITPNLELHVRSPLSHRETKLVSRLVELADRLINTQEGV